MLPNRCSIKGGQGDCPNPPSYSISIMHHSGEYMVGVVCEEHRAQIGRLLEAKQKRGDLPSGSIKITRLKSVGTNCITNYPDDDD